jgi:hypothetical protein
MRYLILTLFLIGCGVEERERPEFNRVLEVNGFEHYVNLFQEQAKELGQDINVSDLVIRFKHIPVEDNKTTLGRCWRGGNNPPIIDIDPEHWKSMSMVQRQLLMFHEMGHCLLRRDHVDEKKSVSIMNPYLISSQVFVASEDRLIAELFDDSKYGGLELDVGTYSDRCGEFHMRIPDRLGNEVGHP